MPLLLGGIVAWSGSLGTIPEGWSLCDGTNGTPDLRNRFIVGAGSSYSVGDTAGSADSTLVEHTHTGTTNTTGDHANLFSSTTSAQVPTQISGRAGQFDSNPYGTRNSNGAGNHSHTVTINSTGSSATNANLPPYYALAFIQQVQ